ncbi:VOC family protein [Prauserella sediminis]|uniref:VOC family protein n=1 Tax=Prauserella sediminis TaxID=577680 RepID=UPI0038999320
MAADYDAFVMSDTTAMLGFQLVADPTPSKNRLHFDGGRADREALVARLQQLGAAEHETRSVPDLT